jgi:hypothetical protein
MSTAEVASAAAPPEGAARRLARAQNLWLATVRRNGSPHLVPVWFVWHESAIYVCTAPRSVKARNLERNRHLAVALEDGDNPLICEGEGTSVAKPWPVAIVDAFQRKYDWGIRSDSDYTRLLRIQPRRWISW